MKIDDFLKIQKVRCIDGAAATITTGKVYDVIGVDKTFVHVTDDNGEEACYWNCRFEPVLDSAESPLQGMELTPEFEAVEPRFKVGDPVYWGLKSRIFKVFRLMTANVLEVELDDVVTAVHKDELCPATLENYGKLCSLFERIDFEQPPKPLTGSDLARAMLHKGWNLVPCVVSDISDSDALNNDNCCLVDEWWVGSFDTCFNSGDYSYKYAVPFDPRTGEPLTESILND